MPARAAHTRRHSQQLGQITFTLAAATVQRLQETSSRWRHWCCLALSGAVWRAWVPACNPPSATKIWGAGLAIVAPGQIPCACMPGISDGKPLVPCHWCAGATPNWATDEDAARRRSQPRCVLCVSSAGCWEWLDAQITATHCHSSVGPCNPSTRLLAPSLPPSRPLSCILHARLALLPPFCRCLPHPRTLRHVSWTCAHSTLPGLLACGCLSRRRGQWTTACLAPARSSA